jgi:uncharacterized protein YdhG (YjbR/CyaY superfamily)
LNLRWQRAFIVAADEFEDQAGDDHPISQCRQGELRQPRPRATGRRGGFAQTDARAKCELDGHERGGCCYGAARGTNLSGKSAQKSRQLANSGVIFSKMKTDPRVDAYIAEAPAFAQPILEEARSRIGKACPSAEETIKWNVPFFLLGDKVLASVAAFKKHVKVGVWTGMMPKFVDVSEVEELPPSKEFAQQLQTAAKAIAGAMTSKPSKEGSAKPEPKAPATKAPAKATVSKASTKKASAKKAPTKKAPRTSK